MFVSCPCTVVLFSVHQYVFDYIHGKANRGVHIVTILLLAYPSDIGTKDTTLYFVAFVIQ